MKSLGYEIDKRQINQMIDYLDREEDVKKGVITKDAFKRFMSAKMHIHDP
jgi:Ca2+-binding EF-hand superfamily protein